MSTNNTLPFIPLSSYNWSLSHFGTLSYNPTVYSLLSSFFAISLWLVLDLLIQIHLKFKKYRGLYYWCILLTTLGIGLHAIAFILKLFIPGLAEGVSAAGSLGTTALAKVGWVLNTTGFSMVLWSRLGLVVRDRRILSGTLVIIVLDAILLHTPIIIFSFGLSTPSYLTWLPYMATMERIQITGFTVQDLALSTFYTFTSAKLLNIRYTSQRRNLFMALVFAQGFGFVADMVMVVLDYEDMFTLKASLHPFIYAVKLKIEFLVLNQLSCVVRPDGEDFVQWVEGEQVIPGSAEDPAWPSKMGRNGEFDEKESGTCLGCQVLANQRRKRGAETENSIARSEDSALPLTVSSSGPLRNESLGPLDIGQAHPDSMDRRLEDLERHYLGQYR
jgi:hypothetical protein